jgi:hypothetical protein
VNAHTIPHPGDPDRLHVASIFEHSEFGAISPPMQADLRALSESERVHLLDRLRSAPSGTTPEYRLGLQVIACGLAAVQVCDLMQRLRTNHHA